MEQKYRNMLNVEEDKLFLKGQPSVPVGAETHINLKIGGTSEEVYVIEWDADKYRLVELEPGRLVIRLNEVKE